MTSSSGLRVSASVSRCVFGVAKRTHGQRTSAGSDLFNLCHQLGVGNPLAESID